MQKKIAVLIDGGYLRVLARKAKREYNPDFIQEFSSGCASSDEELLRVLYYDCAPFKGDLKLPVSGRIVSHTKSDQWLTDLSHRDLFAVRKGVLKFRGFKPNRIPVSAASLTDDDFTPDFEQKGVDMRIGLDIAVYSQNKTVDRIVLVSNDTDCIPAMKHGRRAGLQIVLIVPPGAHPAPELLAHTDLKRLAKWPAELR